MSRLDGKSWALLLTGAGQEADVPSQAEGGQDQYHEDQEYVDLGHHDPVFPRPAGDRDK